MKLHVIHNEKKKMQCLFNTLVIKNEALEKLYKGGLIGFLDKYGDQCNGKITVLCYMGFEFEETIDDLVESGLKVVEDFYFIDAGSYEQAVVVNDIKQKANWLRGRYVNGYIYVWYIDNNQEDT